ncbi:MAG: dTMP kinase [Lachnospiraceae bacterium]
MGKFIAFDGPNGSGKSTIIREVQRKLQNYNLETYLTSEPTNSELGLFTRKISETIDKESLACLVAADRYNHITNEILPEINRNKIVLSDRYFVSSLLLQRLDGVDVDFIMNLHKKIVLPDLYCIVNADSSTIVQRLKSRNRFTRFETEQNVIKELQFLQEALRIIKDMGINVIEVNTEEEIEISVDRIVENILQLINY